MCDYLFFTGFLIFNPFDRVSSRSHWSKAESKKKEPRAVTEFYRVSYARWIQLRWDGVYLVFFTEFLGWFIFGIPFLYRFFLFCWLIFCCLFPSKRQFQCGGNGDGRLRPRLAFEPARQQVAHGHHHVAAGAVGVGEKGRVRFLFCFLFFGVSLASRRTSSRWFRFPDLIGFVVALFFVLWRKCLTRFDRRPRAEKISTVVDELCGTLHYWIGNRNTFNVDVS